MHGTNMKMTHWKSYNVTGRVTDSQQTCRCECLDIHSTDINYVQMGMSYFAIRCTPRHLMFKNCTGGPAWRGCCMRGAGQLQVVSVSVQLNSVVNSRYSNPWPLEHLSAKMSGALKFLMYRKLSFGGKWRYFCLNVESEGQNKWHSRRKKSDVVCQPRNAERERLRNAANETVGLCM